MNPRSRDLLKTCCILTLLLVKGFPLQFPATASQIRYLGLPGDSGYPLLVALDAQTAHLFFTHFYLASPDAIGISSLRRALINGTWTDITFSGLPPLGSRQVIRPSFSQSTNFSLVYIHYGTTTSIRMQRYEAGAWNPVVTLFTEEELQNYGAGGSGSITNLQAVMDSANHLHLVWERYFEIDILENKCIRAKRGVFYSEYDGESASPPERVVEVEYGTKAVDAPYIDPCGPDFEPCVRSFLTIDPEDHLHLAWFNGATYFTTRTTDGWMEPCRVDTTPYSENITVHTEVPYVVQMDLPLLDFQIDSAGILYFFYSVVPEHNRLLLITYHDATFTLREANLTAPLHPSYYSRDIPMKLFDVARDSTDRFHLVSIEPEGTDSSYVSYQTFKGGFSDPVLVSELGGSEVDLSLDITDTPHIVWRQKVAREEIFYTQQTATGWQAPAQVTNGTEIDHQFGWIGWSPPASSSTTSLPPLPEELLLKESFVGILTISVLLATFRRYWMKKREQEKS